MTLVSPTQVSDGSTADAADINTPINQIAAVINGNIDNSNIPSGAAIDGSKLAANSIDIGAKASVFDGWIAVSDTWTYASATTVTVPSDATTKYSVGDKVKFTNSGAKYFYITAVASTTLTLNGGSDYTVANAAITVPQYSKGATPLGFPQYFNYTLAFVGITAGNGVLTFAKFSMSGQTLNAEWQFVAGSTTAFSAASCTISVPVTIAAGMSNSTLNIMGNCNFDDVSGGAFYPGFLGYETNATLRLCAQAAGGTYANLSSWGTTPVPVAIATGDILSGNFSYKVA